MLKIWTSPDPFSLQSISLQHSDRYQHLVGGWDHASWDVFPQRLMVNWRCCSCHHTHRDSWVLSQLVPLGGTYPSLMATRHCLTETIMLIFHEFLIASLWLVYLYLLKALTSATLFYFYPLNSFLASEISFGLLTLISWKEVELCLYCNKQMDQFRQATDGSDFVIICFHTRTTLTTTRFYKRQHVRVSINTWTWTSLWLDYWSTRNLLHLWSLKKCIDGNAGTFVTRNNFNVERISVPAKKRFWQKRQKC